MIALGLVLVLLPVACFAYAYAGYPLLLLLAGGRRRPALPPEPREWPEISILLPVYNEAAAIAGTLDRVLALDYPPARRQVVVVSDASNDGTDAIVEGYAARGVTLVRVPERGGKTAAENFAIAHCRGAIVVTMDATITVEPAALKALVRAMEDPTVGVASGRDVSVNASAGESNTDEGSYVGFEMWLRGLETRVGSIVGASGCFFAARRELALAPFPAWLSKDFAMPLRARRAGFRSVSVDAALCYVRRAPALGSEYRRKVRTMARGLATLWHERALLDPFRFGRFAWMLWSHKLFRWLVFLTLPFALIGLALLAPASLLARLALAAVALGAVLAAVALRWPAHGKPPRLVALCGFVSVALVAGVMAWVTALRGRLIPVWEPTRR